MKSNKLFLQFTIYFAVVVGIISAQLQTNDGCTPGSFPCKNGQCILPELHCDGNNDCNDNSDETECAAGKCMPSFFQCQNGNCIPSTWVCNLENDCNDNSDEGEALNCPVDGAVNRSCSSAQFQCENQQCVPVRWKCDGKFDCEDHSDEDDELCWHHHKFIDVRHTSGVINFTYNFLLLVSSLFVLAIEMLK